MLRNSKLVSMFGTLALLFISISAPAFSAPPTKMPCALGGSCLVGDTGPGGGIVYYVNRKGFICGPNYTAKGSPTGRLCRYLEVAPSGWSGGSDPTKLWAVSANQSSDVADITNENAAPNMSSTGIGLGYKNSLAIVAQGNDNTTAAGAARAYAGGGKNGWYLPTTAELNLLCQWNRGVAQGVTTFCAGGSLNSGTGAGVAGFIGGNYWSSSEYDAYYAWGEDFDSGFQNYNVKYATYFVRPIRGF